VVKTVRGCAFDVFRAVAASLNHLRRSLWTRGRPYPVADGFRQGCEPNARNHDRRSLTGRSSKAPGVAWGRTTADGSVVSSRQGRN
jgi:hypothetical protein